MEKSPILMTGAAGYVGSHVLRLFLERERPCVVVDNLSKGHREAVPAGVTFYRADIGDKEALEQIFSSRRFSGILHFAGFIEVGESMSHPQKYIDNNLVRPIPFLEAARRHGAPWIVFSSSAAVYGEPAAIPLEETAPKHPNNPYGVTKWAFEEMLQAYERAYGMRSISLRYFNAAGAHPSGELGEAHDPESHLIPRICQAALEGREPVSIYGDDYATPDGTCVRDYVHILDLAETHLLAAQALESGHPSGAYNIGSGRGHSVKKVINAVERASGKKIPKKTAPRRKGDSAVLVASSKAFQREFSWTPEFQSLEKIVESAWMWHSKHPAGFEK